jgi:acyl-CoA synthetase (AMP-forming)/AMP-acid ligase II
LPGPIVTSPFGDIVTSARRLAETYPQRELFRFLEDGEERAVALTCAELDHRARRIAAALQARRMEGERVLVTLLPGAGYVAALLGCFYAGAVAVPSFPATRAHELKRISDIARDCAPRMAIVEDRLRTMLPDTSGMEWCGIGTIMTHEADAFVPQPRRGDDVAIIQYTSGSTGNPKGVCITHDNLSWNSWQISAVQAHRPYIAALWLPPYHDMGLVGILHGFFTGSPLVLMSALHFLQRPLRWLKAISRYGATLCAAPDFAYRLCAERIAEEDRAGLDLSTLEIAYCGAEPVRKSTLDLFASAFRSCGFRADAFHPCYGLAEATLMVTSRRRDRPIRWATLPSNQDGEPGEPETADERSVASCGQPALPTEVALFNPETGQILKDGEAGEICVRGPAVSAGYWGSGLEAALNGGWRRTGDRGLVHDGELYITGRLKTLIIVRGRNIQAEDIELAAGESHPLSSPSRCVAVGVDHIHGEQVHLVLEAPSRTEPDACREMLEAARAAVLRAHNIHPARILVVRRGALPRTTSGKLRRAACRKLLADDALTALASWHAGARAVA